MRGEYLLVELMALLFGIILYKMFNLRFLSEKKALMKVLLFNLVFFGVWDVLAFWRGHWTWTRDLTIGYVGVLPIEEFVFIAVAVVFIPITLWEVSKKITK